MAIELNGANVRKLMPNGYYDETSYNLIFNLIELANPQINFTKNQVRLTDIRVEENLKEKTNTIGKLVGIPEMGREGEFTFIWTRRDLSEIFRDIRPSVPVQRDALMISDYLPVFNDQWGFQLGSGDIYDEPIMISDLPKVITIRFRENCPAFYGSFKLAIGMENISLNSILIERKLVGLSQINYEKPINGPMYNWGQDMTGNHVKLTEISTGTNVEGELAEYFSSLLPHDWVDEPSTTDFNFHGSYVFYNGTTQESPVPCNKRYERVLVILLHPELCDNVAEHLIFHYDTKMKEKS